MSLKKAQTRTSAAPSLARDVRDDEGDMRAMKLAAGRKDDAPLTDAEWDALTHFPDPK